MKLRYLTNHELTSSDVLAGIRLSTLTSPCNSSVLSPGPGRYHTWIPSSPAVLDFFVFGGRRDYVHKKEKLSKKPLENRGITKTWQNGQNHNNSVTPSIRTTVIVQCWEREKERERERERGEGRERESERGGGGGRERERGGRGTN